MAIAITQTKNFVGGEWLDAVEGGTMEVHNPATGDVIAEVPSGSAEDVEQSGARRPGPLCPNGSRRRRASARSCC